MLGNVNKYHSRYMVLGGCNTDIRGTLSGYRQTLQVLEEQQCERAWEIGTEVYFFFLWSCQDVFRCVCVVFLTYICYYVIMGVPYRPYMDFM